MPRSRWGQRGTLPAAVHRAVRTSGLSRPRRKVALGETEGTVILPFGRYFAGRADLLSRPGFKMLVPIDGVSPFSGVGEPDPQMQRFADSERVNERVKTEVHKDLAAQLAQADADYLVVDNSTALMLHRELNGRLYALLGGESTELMDTLWNADPTQGRALAVKLSHGGFTASLRAIYDCFIHGCLDSFDPAKIILVRSHVSRFWVAEDGAIAPTDVDPRDALFLEALDGYFVEQTGCRVASDTLGYFPSAVQWQAFDHRLRRLIEEELVDLCTSRVSAGAAGPPGALSGSGTRRGTSAADHVVGAFRQSRPVDRGWLLEYFTAGTASYDDLLALACLEQGYPGSDEDLIRACVRCAVTDTGSHPLAATRRRFDRSLRALRGWRWCSLKIPRRQLWTPQITVTGGPVCLRFLGDGSIGRILVSPVRVSDADAVVDGRLPVTPLNLLNVIGSWPVYLERGRRGIITAPQVLVDDVDELVDTCMWIDWASILDNERIVITAPQHALRARPPHAKTDLSFIFDPNTRIGTVGGGLMDQVTHITLFDNMCTPHGLDYYLDDLAYIWRRSHDGFQASRLAPQLERRRLSRLVSQELIESFREEVKTRLPWVFNQSQAWYDLGLREATVVTGSRPSTQRLLEIGPEFPVRVYTEGDELAELIREPPTPICFYTTLDRIPIVAESAEAIRRVFSYHHLEARGLDPDVARTADLLRRSPHVAIHVRRGDYVNSHFDRDGWFAQQSHYIPAIDYLVESEFKTSDINVAIFSDDLEFVAAHLTDYGLDRLTGQVRFIRGNNHFKSIFDSYLMSLCPVIVGSVGSFAATTSLLADPPSVFILARPELVQVAWRRS